MIVADWFEATADVVAVNVALVAPVGTLKTAGTETVELLLAKLIPAPSVETTALERPTEQTLDAPPVTVVGLH